MEKSITQLAKDGVTNAINSAKTEEIKHLLQQAIDSQFVKKKGNGGKRGKKGRKKERKVEREKERGHNIFDYKKIRK